MDRITYFKYLFLSTIFCYMSTNKFTNRRLGAKTHQLAFSNFFTGEANSCPLFSVMFPNKNLMCQSKEIVILHDGLWEGSSCFKLLGYDLVLCWDAIIPNTSDFSSRKLLLESCMRLLLEFCSNKSVQNYF